MSTSLSVHFAIPGVLQTHPSKLSALLGALKEDEVETKDKLGALRAWASKLDKEIQDQKAKELLLGLAKNWLGDVESGTGPASMLVLVEQLLEQAQKAVNDYGPTVRILG